MKGYEGMEARDQAYADDTTDRISKAQPANKDEATTPPCDVRYDEKWQSTLSRS
jgi:hypothetical protein